MKRMGLAVVVAIGIAVAAFFSPGRPDHITLTAGKATPMEAEGTFMASLDIANDGPADKLLSVASPDALKISLMNPAAQDSPLVVPGGDTAQLALDGAHLMVQAAPSDFPEGGFLPVTLIFEKAGQVVARLQNTGPAAMRHGGAVGVEPEPAPVVALDWSEGPGPEGGIVRVRVQNLRVMQVPDGTAHVSGEGHAHAYLNGLKLGRVYGDTLTLGALLPGDYALTVSLNTHDHRPYLAGGTPVAATLRFTIP